MAQRRHEPFLAYHLLARALMCRPYATASISTDFGLHCVTQDALVAAEHHHVIALVALTWRPFESMPASIRSRCRCRVGERHRTGRTFTFRIQTRAVRCARVGQSDATSGARTRVTAIPHPLHARGRSGWQGREIAKQFQLASSALARHAAGRRGTRARTCSARWRSRVTHISQESACAESMRVRGAIRLGVESERARRRHPGTGAASTGGRGRA